MNEFIVWDETTKRFYYSDDEAYVLKEIDNVLHIVEMDNFYNNKKIEESVIGKALPYIGKTDDTPEKNKIYADCSIVEFQYYDGEDVKNLTGYFYYCNEEMQYEIEIIKGDENSGKFDFFNLIGLRIIGTLQQDKHLLKDN